jgi:hypothetical protein
VPIQNSLEDAIESYPNELGPGAVLIIDAIRQREWVPALRAFEIRELDAKLRKVAVTPVHQTLEPILEDLIHGLARHLAQTLEKERLELPSRALTLQKDQARLGCKFIRESILEVLKSWQIPGLEVLYVLPLKGRSHIEPRDREL